jgi:hypothetical protein
MLACPAQCGYWCGLRRRACLPALRCVHPAACWRLVCARPSRHRTYLGDAHAALPALLSAALCDYIKALQLPKPQQQQVLDAIAAVDFSSARAALMASVPGVHHGEEVHK